MKTILAAACMAATVLAGGMAQATSIAISPFTAPAFGAATANATPSTIETFEGYSNGRWDSSTLTNVGMFSSVGGTGSGTVCRALNGAARCDGLALQEGTRSGQGNLWPVTGTRSLSSGDTFGIVWDVFTRAGDMFTSIVFGLSDAADVGGTVFSVTADGVTRTLTGQRDGNRQLVSIVFDRAVTNATVSLVNRDSRGNLRTNDGFTIDGAAINLAPVPLPASGLLLVGAVGGLGAIRRWRRKAA